MGFFLQVRLWEIFPGLMGRIIKSPEIRAKDHGRSVWDSLSGCWFQSWYTAKPVPFLWLGRAVNGAICCWNGSSRRAIFLWNCYYEQLCPWSIWQNFLSCDVIFRRQNGFKCCFLEREVLVFSIPGMDFFSNNEWAVLPQMSCFPDYSYRKFLP